MDLSKTRRMFLRSGALVAGAVCVAPSAAFAWTGQPGGVPIVGPRKGERPTGFAFGVASYTFRDFNRAQVIGFMKQLRLTDLNVKDVKDHLPSTSVEAETQAIEDYKAAGIKLTAAGNIAFAKDDDADIRAKFEYCKRAGIKVIVCDPEVAVLPRLERFVKEYDMRLAIHNHGPEHKVFHSPLDVLAAVRNMDQRIGCCIDVGHTIRAGVDPVAAIRTVGPRLYDLHVKDLGKPDARDSQVDVGEGLMPFREMFQALMDLKYAGHVDLEYEIHADNPMPGVIESFGYMRGVLAGMGLRA